MKFFLLSLLFILCLPCIIACKHRQEVPERTANMSSIFAKSSNRDTTGYDLAKILRGGELIVTTISSPETYYDYHGIGMGLQYALAENFAEIQGLTVRVEVATDTMDLVKKVLAGEADLIAYPLSKSFLKQKGLIPAGYHKSGFWSVRKEAPKLAEALNDWYKEGIETDISKAVEERTRNSYSVERKAQAVYLSRERGVISVYDNLFKNASAITGWDWKLIAAQCYQESAFDPNARSYVGARGLMQLMPRTAESLGVQPEEICNPEKNVDAAARHILKLEKQFFDIKDRTERIKFVLASYNGGPGHVRDAMALSRKYGHNPFLWNDVAPYILALSQPEYYKDPVVKRGYMIGRETAGYVQKILERWRDYGGRVVVSGPPQPPAPLRNTSATIGSSSNEDATAGTASPSTEIEHRMNNTAKRPNRYTTGTKVMRPDDPSFNQME